MTRAKPAERVPFRTCAACGKDDGRDDARPPESQLRLLLDGTLAYACSRSCAIELGWAKP